MHYEEIRKQFQFKSKMNGKSDTALFNENVSKKRKLEESLSPNKRSRILRTSPDFVFPNKRLTDPQTSFIYTPNAKSNGNDNSFTKSFSSGRQLSPKKFSANDRLKTLRKYIETTKNNVDLLNKSKSPPGLASDLSKVTNNHLHYAPTVTAKPSSLEERLRSIRNSNNLSSKPAIAYSYYTSSQNSSIKSPNTSQSHILNNSNNSANTSSESMDWSYVEEKKVLSKINEMRNEEIITRVTPSTTFQENLAKELMDIPVNDSILKDIYVVIDTNIFISHLDIVTKLLDIKVNGVVFPILLIPWIVIQELDYLKESRSESKLRNKAQAAIYFINDKLSKKHQQVKGQSVRDAAQQNFSSKCADDSILHCCLQVVEKQNRAMLLSNDLNLRNKALINNVFAYSHAEIIKALDPYRDSHANPNYGKGLDIELYFKNFFSFVIFTQLREAYGNALSGMQIELRNPPWDLTNCLSLFQRFWQPIFSIHLQNQFSQKVNQYLEFLNKNENIDTLSPANLKLLVDQGLALCVYIKNGMPMYKDNVNDCIASVDNILKTLVWPDPYIP